MRINYKTKIFFGLPFIAVFTVMLMSCASVDLLTTNNTYFKEQQNDSSISIVTYNIKAIYDKEETQVDSLMDFINRGKFNFVVFQELFDESTRCEIVEKTDTNYFGTIISRVDYVSVPEFIFQDSGLFMMSTYPRVDLSDVDFGSDINNSNGVVHMVLDKEYSRSHDYLANKSVMGTLFSINDSSHIFLFGTHVQALGTTEHKEFQLEQIKGFIAASVKKIIETKLVEPKNLAVLLAGDFNSNAYSVERFNSMRQILGNPRDLHKEYHGTNEQYTFVFRQGRPSRRFDYIFAYDKISDIELKQITLIDSGVEDVKDIKGNSISDHISLKALFNLE